MPPDIGESFLRHPDQGGLLCRRQCGKGVVVAHAIIRDMQIGRGRIGTKLFE